MLLARLIFTLEKHYYEVLHLLFPISNFDHLIYAFSYQTTLTLPLAEKKSVCSHIKTLSAILLKIKSKKTHHLHLKFRLKAECTKLSLEVTASLTYALFQTYKKTNISEALQIPTQWHRTKTYSLKSAKAFCFMRENPPDFSSKSSRTNGSITTYRSARK